MPDSTPHIAAGHRHAVSALDMIGALSGSANATLYAAGMAAGVRDWLLKTAGPRAAYDILQGITDDVLAAPSNAAQLEGEIAKIVHALKREARRRPA